MIISVEGLLNCHINVSPLNKVFIKGQKFGLQSKLFTPVKDLLSLMKLNSFIHLYFQRKELKVTMKLSKGKHQYNAWHQWGAAACLIKLICELLHCVLWRTFSGSGWSRNATWVLAEIPTTVIGILKWTRPSTGCMKHHKSHMTSDTSCCCTAVTKPVLCECGHVLLKISSLPLF